MSIETNTYLGPYLFVAHKEVKKAVSHRECDTDKCKGKGKRAEGMFCQHCGLVLKTIESFKTERVCTGWASYNDGLNVNEDEFFRPAYVDGSENWDTYLPNRISGVNWGENTDIIIPERIENEMEEFHEKYEKELMALRSYFGDDNVNVRWGLVTYQH